MAVIAVVNPKGGVGKSTLSSNVAGFLARQGRRVALGDVDRQQSARTWLSLRPAQLPPITHWATTLDDMIRLPKGLDDAVLDTPAGLHGKALSTVLKWADQVLVPIQPSPFDIHAVHDFFIELGHSKRMASVRVGVVGMRLREGTHAAEQLSHFLGQAPYPVVGGLRDTQNYAHLAAHGLSLWDVAPSRVERDLEQWQALLNWLRS
jgi:chromosome partitioning protein